ncbi:MAG: aldose epimerase [Actinobacteria bacterium]|nr:aldose epimerase [Actinomycetota bacterium]
MSRRVVETVDGARIEVDLDTGCRLASLEIGGHEILVGRSADPLGWGCYPMAPYAGRVRAGRFSFQGRTHRLPRNLGGHAIHGSVFLRPWEPEGDHWYVTDLGPDWPFRGWARQQIRLGHERLDMRLEVHSAAGAMPASCGWHPWFRRVIGGARLELDVSAGFVYERDDGGITTRRRAAVPAGPWDDCFGDVVQPVGVEWPGVLRLDLTASSDEWVIYTEPEDAVCVEPQTAPPDALNHDPFVVETGRPLTAEFTLEWRMGGEPAA